ncbi:MAG: ADP-glyceromanno-heptose 6-epimerase [Verrucomicrobia bacterium]|nr:ADP-glyceromanno-heptose 6-epimerase [Verrucomicrobiota bacterium]
MILVTGAAGMIGSCTVRELNDRGHTDLLLVDDLKQGEKWKNLVGKYFVDLISRHKIMDWLKGREDEIDAIVHLGACSDTVETNADYLMENNFRFSIRLAEWALTHNKRFIYASSAATYGDGNLGFTDDESSIETLKPLNMYAFSKQLVDLWLKREKVLDRVVGLKYFNVFGPNEYHKGRMASMVLKMTGNAKRDGKIQLYKSNDPKYTDGGQCRDFIYVKDAVRMTCAFLENRSLAGLYNIGQGQVTTWNELADALFNALNQKTNIEYIEMPEELSRQYQNYTRADMNKINRVLAPHEARITPIREAVREYIQDYLLKSARW